jgi:hypothetical protein
MRSIEPSIYYHREESIRNINKTLEMELYLYLYRETYSGMYSKLYVLPFSIKNGIKDELF